MLDFLERNASFVLLTLMLVIPLGMAGSCSMIAANCRKQVFENCAKDKPTADCITAAKAVCGN